jgi:signal transduction histidine kinase
MKIQSKFILVFFITSFLPLIFLAYVNFNTAEQALIEETRQKLETIAELEIIRIRQVANDSSLLLPLIADYRGLGDTGEVIVAKRGPDGSVVYLTPRRFEPLAKNPSILMEKALNGEENFFSDVLDYRGVREVAITRYLSDLGLGVLVKIDRDEALQSIDALRDVILVFSFIFILLIVMVSLFFVHSITAPILNLVSVAKRVRTGDFSRRAMVLTKDEIGELSVTFNSMINSLQDLHLGLEKKIAERTLELAVSNKDLEAFTYSVSHDLRAPLRSIDGFSKILEDDYAEKFDEDGKHVIATIRASIKRMGELIDDLLAFSRLGRRMITTTDVDMTSLVKAVFEELKHANPERSIQFTCEELPPAHADASLMHQVLVNLLSNAIKFTRKKDMAIITVGNTVIDGNIVYYVKDNGVGFDMKYVGKLFNVFQRLHTTQEFEGTGVGLSIVSRIINKHGGRVWAEAEIDHGAIFYFSLPGRHVARA